MSKPLDIVLGLSSADCFVLVCCVQHFTNFFKRNPPQDDKSKADQRALQSVMQKLSIARSENLGNPYDTNLTFSVDEQGVVDFALHMAMTDATVAKSIPVSDDRVIPDVMLSDLAPHVPLMRDLLRRLDVAQRLTHLEHQVYQLWSQIETSGGPVTKPPQGDEPSTIKR